MKIGSYEILGELGRGGMGVVYRARGETGEVAIKALIRRDEETLARFDRERRLLATFTAEDGFVPLLEAGTSPLGPYLVMPLVTGGTLRARLARGPMGVEPALALGRALGAALARAHARGVVHRDLKPENVLFAADGTPLIADLGLAKHFGPDRPATSVSLSRTGVMRGTAGYMPVEQMTDAKTVGPAADVFALGAILHECLAGAPAFPGESGLEVLSRVDAGRYERLARPDVPPWLVAALERALERDAPKRFADAALFLRALAPARAKRTRALAVVAAVALAAGITFAVWPRPRGPVRAIPTPSSAPPSSASVSSATTPAPSATPARARVRVDEPHTKPILALAVARASGEVATASDDGSAKVWEVATGALRTTLGGHKGAVRAVALSMDRKARLVATADRSTVRIWDRERGGQITKTLPTEGAIYLEFVQGDGGASELMVGTEDGRVSRWLFPTDGVDPIPVKLVGPAALDYKWLAGSIVLFAGGRDGAVSLYDLVNVRWRVPGRPVTCVALATDQKHGLSGDRDGVVSVWDVSLEAGSVARTSKHAKAVTGVSISPDSKWGLSGAADGSARLLALGAATEVALPAGAPVRTVTFVGPQAALVARETRLELWNLRDATEPQLAWSH